MKEFVFVCVYITEINAEEFVWWISAVAHTWG